MPDLREFYNERILDHYKHPRNHRALEGANRRAEGNNPLCGDRIVVHVRVAEDKVKDIAFEGEGCAICMASASVMTEAVKGKSISEAGSISGRFYDIVTGHSERVPDPSRFGNLGAFASVSEFPIRVKCATLAWQTLQAAIASRDEVVTTE